VVCSLATKACFQCTVKVGIDLEVGHNFLEIKCWKQASSCGTLLEAFAHLRSVHLPSVLYVSIETVDFYPNYCCAFFQLQEQRDFVWFPSAGAQVYLKLILWICYEKGVRANEIVLCGSTFIINWPKKENKMEGEKITAQLNTSMCYFVTERWEHPQLVRRHWTRLSLSLELPVALIFTLATNLGELYQLQANSDITYNIKGPSSIHSHNGCLGYCSAHYQ